PLRGALPAHEVVLQDPVLLGLLRRRDAEHLEHRGHEPRCRHKRCGQSSWIAKNGRRERNAPTTKKPRPVRRSTVAATARPATKNEILSRIRNARGRDTRAPS